MKIAIDASRATVKQRTGTEGYSLHIIRELLACGDDHDFILYFRDDPPPELIPRHDRVDIQVIRRPRLWSHTGLGPVVKRDQPDVLFVPSHVIPWPDTGSIPAVVTIHDLGYIHYPDKHPVLDRLYLGWSTRHSVRTARRVLAVSQATAHDLHLMLNTPEDKIQVVHSGIDSLLRPVDDPQKINRVRQRFNLWGPYILHVGSLQPRKNLGRLVEAFEQIANRWPELSLVLAGRIAWGHRRLEDQIRQFGLKDRVILTGYLSDEDLPTLYSEALVYAFPSLYEGFGFPALEAMACHTPVVCSNTSSLPELVGDAALTVAPTDVGGLAEALNQVIGDEELRHNLIEKGRERVKAFTWEACARSTLAVLQEAASITRDGV